jgi:hypothetical protein
VQPGDVLAVVVQQYNGGTITPPSTWTPVPITNTPGAFFWAGTYVAQAGDAGSTVYFKSTNASYTMAVSGFVVEGADGHIDAVTAASVFSNTQGSVSGLTTTLADDVVYYFVPVWGDASDTGSTVTGTPALTEDFVGSLGGGVGYVGHLTQATPGPVGAETVKFTYGGNSGYIVTMALAMPVFIAPNAAANLTPSGTTVDRTVTQRIAWDYSNQIASDGQSKFDLQWRHQGSSDAWNTVSQTTPNAWWDAPGGTFPAEGIEWQVRTYDQGGLVGPWSQLTYFTAANPTATPTITAPTSGGTIGLTPETVSWSAGDQQAYQVRRVADNAGSPDTGTIYWDSGITPNPTARSLSVAFPTNNRPEHIQVRVQAADGLWSSWADELVHVSYTAPATPTLTVTANNATASITVTPNQPAPGTGQPTVTSIDIWCRTAASSAITDPQRPKQTGARLAAGVNPTAAWVDYAAASTVEYEYQVVANGSNTTTAPSAWTG